MFSFVINLRTTSVTNQEQKHKKGDGKLYNVFKESIKLLANFNSYATFEQLHYFFDFIFEEILSVCTLLQSYTTKLSLINEPVEL